MQDTPLNRFVEAVMRVNAGFAGMGGASAGIIGTSSTNTSLVNRLHQTTLAFAAEYVKPQPDRAFLVSLARQIEGNLRSVRLIDGMTDKELDSLLRKLYALDKAADA